MLTVEKLTKRSVAICIAEFIARYNKGDYKTACDFYAEELLYYDGVSTLKKSRGAVLADIKQAAAELVGTNPIVLTHQDIDVSIDGRSSHALVRFTIGCNEFSAQMTVEWIDGLPQVTYDRTIAI